MSIQDICAADPSIMADARFVNTLTAKEEALAKQSELQQTLYTDEEAEQHGVYDASPTALHTMHKEDMPGMHYVSDEVSVEADASCLDNPLYYVEGIDVDALAFVLEKHSKAKTADAKNHAKSLRNWDKPLVKFKPEAKYELVDVYTDELNGYDVHRYSNGENTYEKTIEHTPNLAQDEVEKQAKFANLNRDKKAWSILWKHLNASRKSYKMYYNLFETSKNPMHKKAGDAEYKYFVAVSKRIDRVKELEKKSWDKKNYDYKCSVLNKFVAYQQACIKKGEDPAFTWEQVKKIKKIR